MSVTAAVGIAVGMRVANVDSSATDNQSGQEVHWYACATKTH